MNRRFVITARSLGIAAALALAIPIPGAGAEPIYAFNCGGNVVTDAEGNTFAADQPYAGAGAGYVGGVGLGPSHVVNSAGWSCRDPALHLRVRERHSAYRFDLPPGDYLLRLYWLEGLVHGPRLRQFDVRAEGQALETGLDLAADPGFMMAYERSYLVSVTDGTLDLEFTAERRSSQLSALALWQAEDPGLAPPAPAAATPQAGYGMNILTWEPDHDPGHALLRIYAASEAFGSYALIAERPAAAGRFFDLQAPVGVERWYRLSTVDCWAREGPLSLARAATALHWSSSELPVFRLYLDGADLDSLNSHPFADEEYPALWGVGAGPLYSVEARYRGGMARSFRKKSWKIVLPDALDYGGLQALHLVANPDDIHLIKNEVSLRIFDDLLPWSSRGSFVHLEFNGEYWGVYELVEEVDEDFLAERGIPVPGKLYKAYSDMRPLSSESDYRGFYDLKAGPDEDFGDLIYFIEGLSAADEYSLPGFLVERIDLENFFEYYAMMVYTRQHDFIQRNYYLYHDLESARWSLIPWDMNLSFHWDDLPLDFGTAASPHWVGNAYNRLIDALLSVPRLRLEYARRLEHLTGTVLNRPALEDRVESIYDSLAVDAALDVHKAWLEDNQYLEVAAGAVNYRLGQRDADLLTMLPAFIDVIPTLCLNELQVFPPAGEGSDRNMGSSWIELYNFGDAGAGTAGLELTAEGVPGSGVPLPPLWLEPGEHRLLYLDGLTHLGSAHLPLLPELAGGTWVLIDGDGAIWDRVRYGPANALHSEGRHPDGWPSWHCMPITPMHANLDLQAPVFGAVTLLPESPSSADSLFLAAALNDPAGRPLTLRAYYRLGEGGVKNRLLRHDEDGIWRIGLPPLGAAGQLKWWLRAENDLGLATNDPPGAPFYHHTVSLGAVGSQVLLNELMADNETVHADEAGEFDDWLELYNGGQDTLDLAGYGLSDDPADPLKWTLPAGGAGRIAPGSWLLIWADEDLGQGPLHANFKLSRAGEALVLSLPDGTPLDMVLFGPQAADVSYGRLGDGGPEWGSQALPTPGATNAQAAVSAAAGLQTWPNPFNPDLQIRFVLPIGGRARVAIFDVRGRCLRRLETARLSPGEHRLTWDGRDAQGRSASSGHYLLRIRAPGLDETSKSLLIK